MKVSSFGRFVAAASVGAALAFGAVACACPAATDANAEQEAPAAQEEAADESAAAEPATSEATTDTPAAQDSADPNQLTAAEAQAQGYQVFQGTVHVCSAEELLALQGKSDVDPAQVSHGGTYAVVAFDEALDVTGMYGDGSGETNRTATMLGVAELTEYDTFTVEFGDLEVWRSLDGQRVTVAAKAQDIWFPSDVRMPMGEPTANTVQLLAQE